MNTVYLNGVYLPMSEAKISPMDRGFLFGDGIYEVIPSYGGKLVGFHDHIERLNGGLAAIDLALDHDIEKWSEICQQLSASNGHGNLGIYLHVSRGADTKRFHGYPEDVPATVYAFTFEIPPSPGCDPKTAKTYTVTTAEDLRWKRCNIKSTALLGNVMHFNQGLQRGHNETILYNDEGWLTEASACNVYVIKNGVIATPFTDHQILPGITRLLLLKILRSHSDVSIEERNVSMDELHDADEVWLSSSTKEIAPVVAIDDQPVGNGHVGPVWANAQALFSQHKYDY